MLDFEKIIVAPQIVIYKNIFNNSKKIIDYIEEENLEVLVSPLEEWFNHGYRAKSFYNKKNKSIPVLDEISDIFEFIKNDYLNDFEKEKGIWPDWIENWDSLRNKEDNYIIDYFKYDWKKSLDNMQIELNGNIMNYHVDEFPIEGIEKAERNIVTINFYINDNYEGGEICAYDSISNKSYKYKPSAGDVVVMPSTIPFYHAVKKFKGNDRYFFRLFISYKTNNILNSKNISSDDSIKNHTGTKAEEEYRKNFLQFIKVDSEEIEVV